MGRCTAKSKSTGERCKSDAMMGQKVCYNHGGAAPQNLKAARKRIREAMLSILPDALSELRRIIEDDDESARDKLKAIEQVINKLEDKEKVQHEHKHLHEVRHKFDFDRLQKGEKKKLHNLLDKARKDVNGNGNS